MKQDYSAEFEAVWKLYPSRGVHPNPKKLAYKCWLARLREGVSWDTLRQCVTGYAEYCGRERKTGTDGVMMASTFFGPNERFVDFLPRAEQPRKPTSFVPSVRQERPMSPEEAKKIIGNLLGDLSLVKQVR